MFHLYRYNSAPIGHILTKEYARVGHIEPFPTTWAWARRALSSDPSTVFLGAIVSEKKIVKEKFLFPLFPLNRYNSAPVGRILIKKKYGRGVWSPFQRPQSGFPRSIVSEKKIGAKSPFQCPRYSFSRCYSFGEKKLLKKKFFFPLFPLNRYNSAPVGQILLKKISACRARRALSNDPCPVFLGAIVSEKKIVKEKIFFPLFPLYRYNSAPIGQILIKKTWACRARRALSKDPGPFRRKKLLNKIFFSLFPLNLHNSAPIGQILIKKICVCRARRALSNVPGTVFLGAIVSEKKIKKFFFPLFPLNRYNSAPVGQILLKKIWACRARRALSNDPGPVSLGAIVSEKKIVKEKIFFSSFPLNRYNSAPIGQILTKKIWACRPRRALSNDHGPVFLGDIVSEKKIVKEEIFFSLFPLNRYNSAPIGQILIKKIWACRTRRALSKEPGLFRRKKLLNKIFFSLFPLNLHNSAPIGQILIKKICLCRARRALSNVPGTVFLGAIVSEKKIKKFFFPLFPLNRYNSAPVGQILLKKIWACRPRRTLSNDPGPVFLGDIVSEKKIVKEEIFFSLFPLNRYNSAPIGQILIKKIWACRARRALSNDPGLFRRKKLLKKKFFFPLLPFNLYNSAPVGQILIKKIRTCRARRALSIDPSTVFLGSIVSEKKIKKFFFPLFPLNRYNSAPVGQILIKKICVRRARRALSNVPGTVFLGAIVSKKKIAPIGQILIKKICVCRARRALSNGPCTVFLGAIVSEKKIVKEKIFLYLFPLNRYNSAPIGQILIKKIWAYRARRALSNDPGPVFLGAIVSAKKIKKFFFPLFPLNRYNSAPVGQILIKKIRTCRARRALSIDPSTVFLGSIVSEKKIKKFFFPLFPLNRYNSAPVGQILIKKICVRRARRALSNVPGTVFLGAIVSKKKIAPIGQILIKKICVCRARRALSNGPCTVFLGAIVSEKKIVKEKIFLYLFPLNRYNSAPIGQILIKKIWAYRARRALSNDPGPVFLGAIVSAKKISAPVGQILIKKICVRRARRALSNVPGTVFLGAIVPEKKIACRARISLSNDPSPVFLGAIVSKKKIVKAQRALSNGPGTVFLGAIVSEKKIVKEKIFFHLFPLYRYNSAPIGQILMKKTWACRARRALSKEPGPVFLGAIVSEKKIVK
ncbi:LOW QUALITY PROTEIN: hypothetical protein V1477_000092 [Vespula maculifrons]|uniref:Uncharacterized protein n=1 Tax=Vespula maculifrons TaxID=7453 RepID=A0ABD2D2K9_VESMC